MTVKNTASKIDPDYRLLMAVAFLAGFVSLAYEIAATKVLYYFFNESTITASGVIAIFLFGMGLGGFIFSRLEKKISDKKKFLLILQILIALYAAIVFPAYDLVPTVFNVLYPFLGNSAQMLLANKLLISFFYLIIPTVLMGMVFPAIIVMSINAIEQLPEKIGTIYGLDLFGAVLGALASGFFFIPFWGIKALIFFSVLINLAISLLVLFQKSRKFVLTIFCFLLIAFIFYLIISPFSNSAVIYSSQDQKEKYIPRENLLVSDQHNSKYFQKVKIKEKKFFAHSPFGELSVFDEVFNNEQHRYLYIETRVQCSTEGLKNKAVSEINFANISIDALDKANLNVLNIGLGCGFTLSEIVKHQNVRNVDVVEINPVMPEATKYFNDFTGHVLENSKVNLIFNDGYKYLLSTDQKYDLIIMDIEHPSVIYSSNLYSLEFYKLVRKALNQDGIFTQWSYRPIPDAQVINYNTLKTVFADVVPKISGVFNDLYYIAGGRNISMDERETLFLNQMLGSQDTRLNTLNNPYFGTEMMLRELFKVN
ncbi:MAG: fused MFS/spermidine synthase [Smithella sp.]|nr:fused MFS/spermidine synthase [Smithella sp.]HOU50721.1 fused MFS/spermidine synthase [Smithella sp.]